MICSYSDCDLLRNGNTFSLFLESVAPVSELVSDFIDRFVIVTELCEKSLAQSRVLSQCITDELT